MCENFFQPYVDWFASPNPDEEERFVYATLVSNNGLLASGVGKQQPTYAEGRLSYHPGSVAGLGSWFTGEVTRYFILPDNGSPLDDDDQPGPFDDLEVDLGGPFVNAKHDAVNEKWVLTIVISPTFFPVGQPHTPAGHITLSKGAIKISLDCQCSGGLLYGEDVPSGINFGSTVYAISLKRYTVSNDVAK